MRLSNEAIHAIRGVILIIAILLLIHSCPENRIEQPKKARVLEATYIDDFHYRLDDK